MILKIVAKTEEEVREKLSDKKIISIDVSKYYERIGKYSFIVKTAMPYEQLVSKYIREKYSQDSVEAIIANYLNEPENETYIKEFNDFQEYRKNCKLRAEIDSM